MDNFLGQIEKEVPGVGIKSDEQVSHLTSFKIGGNARFFIAIDTIDILARVVNIAWKYSIPVRIIGSGTNAIIPEEGFDGLVIKNNCRKFDLQGMKGKVTNSQLKLSQAFLYAESGAIINQVVRYVLDLGFGGIEYALGLPGTVGGAVVVNANFPKENIRIGRSVYGAKILTKDGVIDVDNDYFNFGEDRSRLLSDRSILLSVLFALYSEEKNKLWERAEQVVSYRINTQPKMLMAGMTFRNMTLTNLYPNSSLSSDVTCEFLLEKAGLKGCRIGDVQLWEENPRYIINKGKGTTAEVKELVSFLKETIFRKFGVQLEVHLLSIA